MSLLTNVDLPEPSDFDDRNVRERIEDQREADFYREEYEPPPPCSCDNAPYHLPTCATVLGWDETEREETT
jgi:hypothetical protein